MQIFGASLLAFPLIKMPLKIVIFSALFVAVIKFMKSQLEQFMLPGEKIALIKETKKAWQHN